MTTPLHPEMTDLQLPELPQGRTAIDYALTTLQHNQVQFSALADAKANIMITVCSIVISVSLTQLRRTELQVPLLTLGSFTLAALFSALLCVIPTRAVPRLPGGGVDKRSPAFNPLFFLHFQYLTRAEFEAEMSIRLANTQTLYLSLIRDVYEQGLVLARSKYRYLRISYLTFMVGLLVSFAAEVWQVVRQLS